MKYMLDTNICIFTIKNKPDMLIAAHAKSLGLTLVTNNTREFGRVEGLQIEDWVV